MSENAELMPTLFVGHGSPMNALETNEFTKSWSELGKEIPEPKAILAISAHWETRGSQVTAMQRPSTIHDFGGFPKKLFEVQYPAMGDPDLAQSLCSNSKKISPDLKWGLDHGSWSVLRHIYPQANIPVVQLSLDYHKSPKEHFDFAKELAELRLKGVLIIGSGNIVHNLSQLAWNKMHESEFGFDWAIEANEIVKKNILNNNISNLLEYQKMGKDMQMAIPTPEHFLPLLYILALKKEEEAFSFFNDKALMGSLTMTSLKIG